MEFTCNASIVTMIVEDNPPGAQLLKNHPRFMDPKIHAVSFIALDLLFRSIQNSCDIIVRMFYNHCRLHWPRGLRHGSSAFGLLGLRVRIPPRTWISVSCECCALSGRGFYDGLITLPEESYRLWRV